MFDQKEIQPTKTIEDKKFIRPVRISYLHVGPVKPRFPFRDLTTEEKEEYKEFGYVKFEEYPIDKSDICSVLGRFWTQKEIDFIGKGCGCKTLISLNVAETYASEPSFYQKAFCGTCGNYFPVGEYGEFVWIEEDGTISEEKVGT